MIQKFRNWLRMWLCTHPRLIVVTEHDSVYLWQECLMCGDQWNSRLLTEKETRVMYPHKGKNNG